VGSTNWLMVGTRRQMVEGEDGGLAKENSAQEEYAAG